MSKLGFWACTLLLVLANAASARHVRIRTDLPQLRSSGVLVIDASNSAVLLSRQAEIATPIASITKLMTALVVLESGQSLNEQIKISADERSGAHGGGPSRLVVGASLSRGELLHLALMSSENRAAYALGRNFPGGLLACVAAMNTKATALGMRHAHFVDPTGLSRDNVASPTDLARLVEAAARNEVIRQYSTDERHRVRVGHRLVEYRNTDSLVRSADWEIIVQKTGYLSEAGRCLVLKAKIQGRSVVMVLLDSFGKYTRVADARRIRKWLETRRYASQPVVARDFAAR
jgi:serine-type D-Ala-D-Ala endopeptidase (penicillin-binding protein 7)